MKIGIVTTTYPRHEGDHAGVFVLHLVEALRKLGHGVRVVAPEPLDTPEVVALQGVLYHRIQPAFARRIPYGAGIVENVKKSPFLILGIPGLIRSLEKAVRESLGDCDVLDACFTAAGIAVARAREPRQAIVYTGHGSDIHLVGKSRLYRWYLRRLLSRYDRVTTVSNYLARKLTDHHCSSNPVVIGNGVAAAVASYAAEWRTVPTVLYASRLMRSKRPTILIRAWAEVVKKIPHAKLIMFGDGPLAQPLRKLVNSLGLMDCVELRGHAPLEAVWREMGRGWLTVLPSLHEGFPMGLIESLAAGVPFLASPCMAELADRTAGGRILPEPLTPALLADSIVAALSEPREIRAMGSRGREHVMRLYSWEHIARKKIELYQDAVAVRLRIR